MASTLAVDTIKSTSGGAATFTLPTADGTAGQVIQTNASGVLSFTDVDGGKGSNVASAAPCVIPDGDLYYNVTGTTNFAAFTVSVGRHFFVQFAGILTMTHHATNLDLPGEGDIITAAGDVAEFFAHTANQVQCVNYTRASGGAIKIADNSIDSDAYVDGSIDNAHIADDAIDSEHYADGSIDLAHLSADCVDGTKIADDAINSEHYTDGSIDNAHLADDAVDSDELAAGAVDNAHIDASAGIAVTKIAAMPYDIGFTAGFDGDMVKEDVAVATYGEMVMARACTITGEVAYVDTAPTGATLIMDIMKNGTTIYASTKPLIAISANTHTVGVATTTALASGDRVTFKITQIGSSEPGEGVRFTLKCKTNTNE